MGCGAGGQSLEAEGRPTMKMDLPRPIEWSERAVDLTGTFQCRHVILRALVYRSAEDLRTLEL